MVVIFTDITAKDISLYSNKTDIFLLLYGSSGVVKIQMKLLCLRLDLDYSVKLIQYSFSYLRMAETVG